MARMALFQKPGEPQSQEALDRLLLPQLLKRYLWAIAAGLLLQLTVGIPLLAAKKTASMVAASLALFFLAVVPSLLLSQGHARFAARFTFVSGFVLTSALVILSGGITSPAIVLQVVFALHAALIMDRRWNLWNLSSFVLLDVALAIFQSRGGVLYRLFPMPPLASTIQISLSFLAGVPVMLLNGEWLRRLLAESKDGEHAIHQLTDRLETLINTVHGVVWEGIPETFQFTFVSRQAEALLGFPLEQWTRDPDFWAKHVHPEDRDRVRNECKRCFADGRDHECEYRLIAADGREVWIHNSITVVREGDSLVSFRGIIQEITERRMAEKALRESEAKFRAVVENSHEGVIFTKVNGELLYRSSASERITGYTNEERLAGTGFEHIHPDDQPQVRRVWDEMLKHPGSVHEVTYRINHKDGTWRSVEVILQNHLDNPNIGAIVGTARDITERVRAEEQLRLSQQKLQTATRHFLAVATCVPDLIWSMDLAGRFTYASPAIERLFGWTVEEFLQLSRRDTAAPGHFEQDTLLFEAELKKAALPDYDRNRVLTIEAERMRQDGSAFWAEINCSLIWSDNGYPVGWTGVTRDITERRKAEADREKLWLQLAQAQKMDSIGRLAGGVAHDFNNLLTVINGYSALALFQLAPADPVRHQMDEIHKAGERAAALTRQLLAFSRKQILQPRSLEINRVLEEMRSMLQRLMGEDVEVRFSLSTSNPSLRADPHQLEQVIMNLSVNARDAMPRGGSLTVATDLVEGNVMLSVSDTGFGMDEATRERIFEPFFTTKRAGEGTGLGLSMVQGIIEQSGGHISVFSEPGEGTTFTVYLPGLIQQAAADDEPKAIPAVWGTETVLVVEDQDEVRNFVVAVLEGYGYHVLPAANAAEAMKICDRDNLQFDLLLTDVVMPHTSGRELASRLRVLRPKIRVLFMSGYTDDIVLRHGVVEEDVQFLQKPFSPDELAGRVREVLGHAASAA
jgi:PAS domain S-box-containing protein